MEANITGKPWSAIPLNYHLYIFEGAVMFLSNLWIVAAIIRYPSLRNKKTYLIMAGLALADAIAGLAYLTAGVYRSYMVVSGQTTIKVTSWDCMLKVHVILFLFGAPLAAVMLICVSVDRLLAVLVPLEYFKFETSYAYKLVGVFYLYGLLSGLGLTFLSYFQERLPLYALTCSAWSAIGVYEYANKYYFLVRVVGGLTSVILYIFVPVLYRKSVKACKKSNQTAELQKIRRQKRLLITCGLSASCTFIFYVFPNILRTYFAGGDNGLLDVLFQYVSVIQNINPISNFVLYMTRHADIREALLNFLFCKPSPVGGNVTAKISVTTSRAELLRKLSLRHNSIHPVMEGGQATRKVTVKSIGLADVN